METFDTIGKCFILRKLNIMNIITTTRRRPREVIVVDILCDKHWNECKKLSAFQSDSKYRVEAKVSNDSTLECQDCSPVKIVLLKSK